MTLDTDLRQGVTAAEHLVLDRADALRELTDPIEFHLRLAERSAAAAVRANPATGNGRRRLDRAREAAAHLLVALNRMDENGREAKQS